LLNYEIIIIHISPKKLRLHSLLNNTLHNGIYGNKLKMVENGEENGDRLL